MRKIIGYLIFIGLLGLMTSCVEEVISTEGIQEGQVAFIISDFESAEQTKSAFQIVDSKLKFQWSADDAIGIFPEEGWQTEFSMEEGAGTNVAVFDGGSWGLKPEAVYYAYYPFSKDNFESKDMRERVKYSYVGQEACFADGEGVVDLSGYDFMASGASAVENESVSFRFQHLGALCRIRFGVPATATYSYFVLESGDERFSMSGYFDATDKDGEGIALIADSEAGTQFKVLFPEGHQVFEGNRNIEFYFLMPPVNLTGQSLVFSVVDDQGNNHDFEIEPKNIVAGMTYSWDVNYVEEATPLGANGTANSYIVSEAGTYCFPAVKGNSSESVGAVSTVDVLWETYGTDVIPEVGALISEVIYADNAITFNASDKKGNAVIAAKDAEGNILWSWHIWMTDQPVDQVYRNGAGTMMDRNLGATSATPGDVGALGLMYQWGRKDPFLGSSSISEDVQAVSTLESGPLAVISDASTGTIAYATANPTTFVTYNSNNRDWLYADDATVDITRWQSNKTIYDPCPAGYRVPDGGDNSIWAIAFGSFLSFDGTHDDTYNGFDFCKDENIRYLTEDETCWYPNAGQISCIYHDYLETNGSVTSINISGGYWSCSAGGDYGVHYFGAHPNGKCHPSSDRSPAYGFPVRCYKENSATATVTVTNLSVEGTANSYIVLKEGTYKFSTVQGNSNTSVGEAATAEVLWETYGTDEVPEVGALVSNVSYADNAITFKASDKKGNALIAAKDAQGNILWSWHIWMTGKVYDQVYNGGGGTMMDRNLGATSATPGDVGALGLLYQWGRKDPFLGSSSISESIKAASTLESWPSSVASDALNGTVAYATANPTTYITQNTNNYDWLYSPDAVVDETRWKSAKTIYDPCPVGYRVPDGGEQGVWARALGTAEDYTEDIYDSVNKGFDFGANKAERYLTSEECCWYPTAGFIKGDGDFTYAGNYVSYWSCYIYNGQAYTFYLSKQGYISSIGGNNMSRGHSVRCQKIDYEVRPVFSETFDWVAPWADTYGSADSVGDNNPSGAAPNVYTQATHLEGGVSEGYPAFLTEFANRGYEDINPDSKVIYTQKYYLKLGRTGHNTGIKLPPIYFGSTPRNVVVKFNWVCQRRVNGGVDETDPVNIVVEVLDAEGNSVFVSGELVTTQPLGRMEWQEASVTLPGITSANRIIIRPSNMSPEANAVNRWYLDNIYIY